MFNCFWADAYYACRLCLLCLPCRLMRACLNIYWYIWYIYTIYIMALVPVYCISIIILYFLFAPWAPKMGEAGGWIFLFCLSIFPSWKEKNIYIYFTMHLSCFLLEGSVRYSSLCSCASCMSDGRDVLPFEPMQLSKPAAEHLTFHLRCTCITASQSIYFNASSHSPFLSLFFHFHFSTWWYIKLQAGRCFTASLYSKWIR